MNLDAELETLRQQHREAHWFEVYCGHLDQRERVIARNLAWDAANEIAVKLQERFHQRNPRRTNWTARLYGARLQGRKGIS